MPGLKGKVWGPLLLAVYNGIGAYVIGEWKAL